MKKRKIRGLNRRLKKIDNWVANCQNLNLEYLKRDQYEYVKFWVFQWGSLNFRNSVFPQPKGLARKKLLEGLFEIYQNWKQQLDELGEEYYLKKNSYFLKSVNYKEDYLLTISSCARYHNLINLIKSFYYFKKKYNTDIKYYLVLTILDQSYFEEINSYLLKKNLTKNVIIILNINPKFLFNLYKFARAYVFSSYSETFGYTSLESMKMNCPVAISNHPSSKEINGYAALYFNPNNINDICKKLHKITSNKKIINKLKKRGKERVKKFSPEHHISGLLKLI